LNALPRIAIALGDPSGIGPEIALKAALDARVRSVCRPLLVGDREALEVHARGIGRNPRLLAFDTADAAGWEDGSVSLLQRRHYGPGEFALGQVGAIHGRASLDAAKAAVEAAMKGDVEAVVAAPQTEKSIALAGVHFDGYPTFVARCTGTDPNNAYLMICFGETRIVHTTLHIGLRRALDLITRERVHHAIASAHTALRRLGVSQAPRIAVSGLNPHAGEDRLFGDEDQDVIAPAITDAKKDGIAAEGPFGCDIMFGRKGYDAFVVMYHDQGHIAAKLLAPYRTAGLTIGTPILFSSVAHGSAHDIAGQGKADHQAMVEAIQRLAGVGRG
jgi:4-hydroxy-L-threonine phosphate dehydrogenase PdxA